MKFINTIRANEWWEYKFPPILLGIYILLSRNFIDPWQLASLYLFILIALFIGAAYVSVLNDITDIEDDRKAGKQNRAALFSKRKRNAIIRLLVLLALIMTWQVKSSPLSTFFYTSSFLAFTLYSVPPFRLKKRGLWGILADACGSQLFPTLFVFTYTAFYLQIQIQPLEIILLGFWSLCIGLRGILWHQFHDLENDRKIGLNTWVQKLNAKQTKSIGMALLSVELLTFLFFMILFKLLVFSLAILTIYLIYLYYQHKKTQLEVIILRNTHSNFSILLFDFYQIFLPIAVLVMLCLDNFIYFILLCVHLLLFPAGFFRVINNLTK